MYLAQFVGYKISSLPLPHSIFFRRLIQIDSCSIHRGHPTAAVIIFLRRTAAPTNTIGIEFGLFVLRIVQPSFWILVLFSWLELLEPSLLSKQLEVHTNLVKIALSFSRSTFIDFPAQAIFGVEQLYNSRFWIISNVPNRLDVSNTSIGRSVVLARSFSLNLGDSFYCLDLGRGEKST